MSSKINKKVNKLLSVVSNFTIEQINNKYDELNNKLKKVENEIQIITDNGEYNMIQAKNQEKKNIDNELLFYKKIKDVIEEYTLLNEMLETNEINNSDYEKETEILKNKIIDLINKKKEDINFGYKGDCILIIEGGEGGEESNLFTKELLESYIKYFNKVGISYKEIEIHKSEQGGYKNVKLRLSGNDKDAYTLMFLENGNHQVMRVPKTEKKGRTHTSIVKIKVLPIIDNINIKIDTKKIIQEGACRAGGKGGQNVNKRETAYQIIYLLDNGEKLIIDSREERYQGRNKELAYERLKEKLFEIEQKRMLDKFKNLSQRSGLRSSKIRTYQFQNNLIKDERVKNKYNLQKILEDGNYNIIHKDILLNT